MFGLQHHAIIGVDAWLRTVFSPPDTALVPERLRACSVRVSQAAQDQAVLQMSYRPEMALRDPTASDHRNAYRLIFLVAHDSSYVSLISSDRMRVGTYSADPGWIKPAPAVQSISSASSWGSPSRGA